MPSTGQNKTLKVEFCAGDVFPRGDRISYRVGAFSSIVGHSRGSFVRIRHVIWLKLEF